MKETLRKERELAHWKEWQQKADEIWGWQTPAGRVRADRRAELFCHFGHMDPNSTVLEVGCGTGEFTQRVALHVKELWASDLSPDLLRKAEQRVRSICPAATVAFTVQDMMHLTLSDNFFDSVFGCSVLHHVAPLQALREVNRVLKPGGWCVFSEPNMFNPQIAIQKNIPYVKRKAGDSPDETAFFRFQAKRLLRDAGFAHYEVQHFDFLHPRTPPRWIPLVDRIGRVLERWPLIRTFSGSLIIRAQKSAH